MKNKEFLHPMKTAEKVFGWIYLVVHIFALPYFLVWLNSEILPHFHLQLTDTSANVVGYALGLVLILIFMFHFMRSSFHDLCDHKLATVEGIFIGYGIYYALSIAVNLGLSYFVSSPTNPNSEAVSDLVSLNPQAIKAIAVILAPIVEEVLFRGVIFGCLRKKSRFLAYLLSIVAFALYHLWQYLLGGFSWELLLYTLQYVPGAVALAWCYEKGKNIYGPIFLHMIMNFITINIDIMMR